MAIDRVKVAGLMGRIDEELAQVGPVPAMCDYEGWRAHQGAYRKIIDDLVAEDAREDAAARLGELRQQLESGEVNPYEAAARW